jgi:hypothetical protein
VTGYADILRAMVGHRLVRVEYKIASNPPMGAEWSGRGAVHEVDHAVLLSTDSMTVALEWRIRDYDEFLGVVTPPSEGASAAVTDVVDVTGRRQWLTFLDRTIAGFGVATYSSGGGHMLPWAIRMGVEGGAAVVVGLGEMRDNTPVYQADNLLVIFEPEMARSYRVIASSDSAWGNDIHP